MQYSVLLRAALATVLAQQAVAAPVLTNDVSAALAKRCTAGIVGVYCPGGHLKDAAEEATAVLEKKEAAVGPLYFLVGERLIPVDEETAPLEKKDIGPLYFLVGERLIPVDEETAPLERRCTAGVVGIYCPAGRPKDDAAEETAVLE